MNYSIGEAFYYGLEAVASVINATSSYDAILAGKLNKDEYKPLESGSLDERRRAAIEIIENDISSDYWKYVRFPVQAEVLAWAKTQNNRKELTYFEGLLDENFGRLKIKNLADFDSDRKKNFIDLKWAIAEVRKFYATTVHVSKSLVQQHRQFIFCYRALRAGYPKDAKAPLLAFVANDHSPGPVAFATLMREIGVPLVYFQHAEVTDAFPRLCFDYCVLRNDASKNIYENRGELISGRTYVVGRKLGHSFDSERLQGHYARLASDRIVSKVVIYPTAIFKTQALRDLIVGFSRNSSVQSVFIKPHPGTSKDLKNFLEENYASILLKEKMADFHLAIVGNSSVVSELLRTSMPVWQNFDLDDIGRDYYKYVSSGLVAEVALSQVESKFWAGVYLSNDWFDKYSKLDPMATKNSKMKSELDELRLVSDFAHLFMTPSDLEVFRTKINASRNIKFFPRTLVSMLDKGRSLGFEGEAVIRELQRMFDARTPALISLLGDVPVGFASTDAVAWLMLKKMEWTGYQASLSSVQALDEAIYRLKSSSWGIQTLENMLLNDIVRKRSVERLDEFWARARLTRVKTLHINRRISIMRWLNSMSEKSLPGIDREILFEGLSNFHRLKMNVQASEIDASLSHIELERQFFECAPSAIRSELERFVLSVYGRIRPRMEFMDVSVNAAQRRALFDLISEKLEYERPFSFIRLSDGEGYIFNAQEKFFTNADALNRERHWWGQELPPSIRSDLKKKLNESVARADVLGIPSIYRFLRDTVEKSVSLQKTIPSRGLLEVLENIERVAGAQAKFADDKLNLALFRDKSDLHALCRVAKRVIIVSSAKEDEIALLFDERNKCNFISVPTHFKTAGNEKYVRSNKPLPLVLNEVVEKVERLVIPGSLCLVAAGIAGKIILSVARRQGGVALDVGSALDEWVGAGIHSLH